MWVGRVCLKPLMVKGQARTWVILLLLLQVKYIYCVFPYTLLYNLKSSNNLLSKRITLLPMWGKPLPIQTTNHISFARGTPPFVEPQVPSLSPTLIFPQAPLYVPPFLPPQKLHQEFYLDNQFQNPLYDDMNYEATTDRYGVDSNMGYGITMWHLEIGYYQRLWLEPTHEMERVWW